MRRLKDNQGSSLAESLVGVTIITFVILFILPMMGDMYNRLHQTQKEVEAWRYLQDVAIEQPLENKNRFSGGWQFKSEWSNNSNSIWVTSGEEVIKVEFIEIFETENQ